MMKEKRPKTPCPNHRAHDNPKALNMHYMACTGSHHAATAHLHSCWRAGVAGGKEGLKSTFFFFHRLLICFVLFAVALTALAQMTSLVSLLLWSLRPVYALLVLALSLVGLVLALPLLAVNFIRFGNSAFV